MRRSINDQPRTTPAKDQPPQLQGIAFRGATGSGYPFDTPVIAGLLGNHLAFRSPVTILVGENGSGKSTLLEAIACAIDAIAIGTYDLRRDASLKAGQALAEVMTPVWNPSRKVRRGFFLRAEDFFGYAMRIDRMRAELRAQRAELLADETLSVAARGFALQPVERELADLERLYGAGLDQHSHGEAFLELFRSRLVPGGLYLLDEPEAPLSPTRQLTLLSMMMLVVREEGAQIIMATHSPIMMAFPGATLLHLAGGDIEPVGFDDVEHISVMRSFLADPDAYLRHL
jgi:predicted ATPase